MIVVAIGRGGELAQAPADIRPLDTHIVTAADVALLRPPAALWGYDMRATDEALNMVARTVTERDVEIATLRRQLADMQSGAARTREGEPDRPGSEAGPGSRAGPGTRGSPLPASVPRRSRCPVVRTARCACPWTPSNGRPGRARVRRRRPRMMASIRKPRREAVRRETARQGTGGRGAALRERARRGAAHECPGAGRAAGARRPAALPVGPGQRRLPRVPRRRVGPPGARRHRHVRAAVPGSIPVRAVLADDPAQAGRLPLRVRGIRHRGGGQVRAG